MVGDGNAERELALPAPIAEWTEPARSIAQPGLAETFTELREPICRYLLALGLPPAEAEEVVQETFLRLCQHLADHGSRSNVRGWLFRVAHNLARDEHRRKQRRPSEPLVDAHESSTTGQHARSTPEQELIAREQVRRLEAALAQLPANQRHCLHLRAEGLKYREIAEVLGAGVSTVAEWVQQALKSLGKECS
jgi:RNA polymerase sigma-70 factor, ECF subfamily